MQVRDKTWLQKDEAADNSVLWPIAFESKHLTSTDNETHYSNIEKEVLGILHDLEKICHYYFACDVSMITHHKQLKAIFRKDMATLSHWLQRILLCIHQYNLRILFKLEPQIFVADWLSRPSHSENQNEEIMRRSLNIKAIETCTDILECMMAGEIKCATLEDDKIGVFQPM